MTRDYRFDNIKLLLMFLVVFGHMLELFPGGMRDSLHTIVYSFHVPVLIFVTGYFARFKASVVARYAILYLVFQTAYLVYTQLVIDGHQTLELQYTTPYWILWYLVAIAAYYLAVPLLETNSRLRMLATFAFSLAVSLWAGTVDAIGYYLSLSRVLAFFPLFVAGFYARRLGVCEAVDALDSGPKAALGIALAVVVCASTLALLSMDVPTQALYESVSYHVGEYHMRLRLLLTAHGLLWAFGLMVWLPSKRIPVLTYLGQHTLPIFLLHGFVLFPLLPWGVFNHAQPVNLVLAVGISAALVCVLGNGLLDRLLRLEFGKRP